VRRPFFCRYAAPQTDVTDISPAPVGGVWATPSAYIGTSNGRILAVENPSPGTAVLDGVVLDSFVPPRPRRIHTGVTPPKVSPSVSKSVNTGHVEINGIVIVEALILQDGSVAEAQVLKPLPQGIDQVAAQLVRRTHFEPSRFFGIPVPVLFNVTVSVRKGVVSMSGGASPNVPLQPADFRNGVTLRAQPAS